MRARDPLHGHRSDEVQALVETRHAQPHRVLGAHPCPEGVVVRAWRPGADAVELIVEGAAPELMERVHPAGLFARIVPGASPPLRYRVRCHGVEGHDPYAFLPTFTDFDEHLFGEGRHWRVHERLGAHLRVVDGVEGVSFAVWAPGARRVSVVGDFNAWDGRVHPMRSLGSSGVWELFVPGVPAGSLYRFELLGADGALSLRADPYARRAELRPGNASIVDAPSAHAWRDEAWIAARAARDLSASPLAIYEVHAGSWRRVPEEADRWLSWRELADALGDYVVDMGFTHVELLPIAEHPFDGSWGYQVTGFFAPTARFGSPDDFRAFVDAMHARGVGVIVDWVPAHFPRDAWALARFDGTALYEHADPRQGDHPDWGTHIFNLGRNEVRNFLLANARMWIEDFHVDGLRVDAVASMLYLDYSRREGEWVPNAFGGRENLESIAFLRELNTMLRGAFPGVLTIAEESTSWPGVTASVEDGGLGFAMKWNMGWMHDTLAYAAKDPLYRPWEHDRLTFGLMYAWSERFVLPLSHDEVVHLKGSLLRKAPGDAWQQFATLRLLLGHMWCHPGKKLLFMGGEIAQPGEWSHERSLDWHLLSVPEHRGVQRLVRDLNRLLGATPALYELDDSPQGFRWVVVDDRAQSVAAWLRFDRRGRYALCVLNATPLARRGYRLGVPSSGWHREAINTDGSAYGGCDLGNEGGVEAEPVAAHGLAQSVVVTVPPLAVLIFTSPE
ncbi:MAG: 1,4-alpha-glucan branching protein GlgB [Polyangiales bacterium]